MNFDSLNLKLKINGFVASFSRKLKYLAHSWLCPCFMGRREIKKEGVAQNNFPKRTSICTFFFDNIFEMRNINIIDWAVERPDLKEFSKPFDIKEYIEKPCFI